MAQKILDVRGKACPEPVIKTQEALKDPDLTELTVAVDNDAAAENVTRMARYLGCEVKLNTISANEFRVDITRAKSARPEMPATDDLRTDCQCDSQRRIVVLVPSDCFGSGDPDLGRALLLAFIKTLKEVVPRPNVLIFINNGAKLPCAGSEFVKPITDLKENGTDVLVCGTCLDFYELEDKLQVGSVSNMFEIASVLAAADHVIRP